MKFLFCPISSHGFVYPLIGIAKALRSNGHEVAFATGDDFEFILREQGIPRISRGDKDGPSFHIGTWAKPLSVGIQVKHIEYAINRFPADVLVTTQLALGPLIVGEMLKLPVAVLGLASYIWPPLWPSGYEPESAFEKRLLVTTHGIFEVMLLSDSESQRCF